MSDEVARVKRRRRSVPRTPLDAATAYLARAAELRLLADQPRPPRAEAPRPPSPPPLAAPQFGESAKVAAAVLLSRRYDQQVRTALDRRLVVAARCRSEALTPVEARRALEQIDGELDALSAQRAAAQGRVFDVKQSIHAGRVAGAARAEAERGLKKLADLFPDEDAPAMPWGTRPEPGTRKRPTPPPPTPTTADTRRELIEKLVAAASRAVAREDS